MHGLQSRAELFPGHFQMATKLSACLARFCQTADSAFFPLGKMPETKAAQSQRSDNVQIV
jgi:hypothetical protein